jgi:hypothetical protein
MCKLWRIFLQEGIDPSIEVIFVGSLPVDVPPESHEVRHSALSCTSHQRTLESVTFALIHVIWTHGPQLYIASHLRLTDALSWETANMRW